MKHWLYTLTISLASLAQAGIVDYATLKPRADYGPVVGNEPALADVMLNHRTLTADLSGVLIDDVSFWNAGYSDLEVAIFPHATGYVLEVTLTPVGFSHIRLNSFYLGSYNQGPERTADVFRVTDGSGNVLWSDEPHTYVANPSAELINVGVAATSLKLLVGTDWNLGVNLIDYTSFNPSTHPVPEPSTLALGLLGAAALLLKFRRR